MLTEVVLLESGVSVSDVLAEIGKCI